MNNKQESILRYIQNKKLLEKIEKSLSKEIFNELIESIELQKEYVEAKVSTNAIISYKDEILLVRLNRPESKKWKLSLPGGKVNKEQTFNQSLRQEVYEETGITSESYSIEKIWIIHNEPMETCKHIFLLKLKEKISSFNFDPEELQEAVRFKIKDLPANPEEYRAPRLSKFLKEYF